LHNLLSGLIILQSNTDPIISFAGPAAAGGMGIGSLYDHVKMRNMTQKNVYR